MIKLKCPYTQVDCSGSLDFTQDQLTTILLEYLKNKKVGWTDLEAKQKDPILAQINKLQDDFAPVDIGPDGKATFPSDHYFLTHILKILRDMRREPNAKR